MLRVTEYFARPFKVIRNETVEYLVPISISYVSVSSTSLFGHICRLPENTPASQAL